MKKMNKIVSVIIPVFNREKYIKRCIESVITQTYKHLEIIIINDGSNDDTLKICLEYEKQDSRITVIDKPNEGVSVARNIGIFNSTGEYILFVDSDDYISSKMVEELVDDISEQEVDIVICGVSRFDKKNRYNVRYRRGKYTLSEYLTYSFDGDISIIDSIVNKIYKTKIIKENTLEFLKETNFGEDLMFNYDYFKNINNGVYISEEVHYNVDLTDTHSLSRKTSKEVFSNYVYIYYKTIGFLKEVELLHENIIKTKTKYSNIIISNVFSYFSQGNVLSNKDEIEKLFDFFQNENVIEIFKDGKLYKSRYKIIYYLIRNKKYKSFKLLMYFATSIKKIKTIIKN